MASAMTTGIIREISRNDRKLSFEWKIPNAISKLGYYCSPGITGWHSVVIAYLGRESDSETFKLIIYQYEFTNSNTRFHCSVCIKNADDVEEELVHDEILHTMDTCRQRTLPLDVNMSQIAPCGTLIVICTLWIDERLSGGGKAVVSRKMKTSSGSHTSARQVERANPDIKGLLSNDSQLSWKRASSSAENERPSDFHSKSSQMTRETASCVTKMETLPSGCQTSSSQISSKSTGSVTDDNKQSTGCQTSSSQMLSNATVSVMDDNRQSTDRAQINVRNTAAEDQEIQQFAMSFISDNIHEILRTTGWLNSLKRDPDKTNQLLIKALERNANKS